MLASTFFKTGLIATVGVIGIQVLNAPKAEAAYNTGEVVIPAPTRKVATTNNKNPVVRVNADGTFSINRKALSKKRTTKKVTRVATPSGTGFGRKTTRRRVVIKTPSLRNYRNATKVRRTKTSTRNSRIKTVRYRRGRIYVPTKRGVRKNTTSSRRK